MISTISLEDGLKDVIDGVRKEMEATCHDVLDEAVSECRRKCEKRLGELLATLQVRTLTRPDSFRMPHVEIRIVMDLSK